MKAIINYLMEQPLLYKLVQSTLAGGGHDVIKKYLKKQIPKGAKKILDQGCGTGEYALLFENKYTGIDNNLEDILFAQKHYRGNFVTGSATKMDFPDKSFDTVFAVGLHHHLNDKETQKAFIEALRVTKNGGKILVVDAMLPKYFWNILGLILRKMDRGRYVRPYQKTLELLPKNLEHQ
jgi:ubiquinone/menaquinone biosynthesis C-methylase UbiE